LTVIYVLSRGGLDMEESLKNESLEVREFLNKNGLAELSADQRETLNRQRGEQHGAQLQGDLPDVDKKPKPHSEVRFRRIRIVASD
jgi:hypothetical protein